MSRYDLTDFEWSAIEPVLPRKSRGVRRVDDRRVLNGIFRVLRSGAPWADLPGRYGPPTTCYNRFRRWTKAGVWDRIMDAVTAAHDTTAAQDLLTGLARGQLILAGPMTPRGSGARSNSRELFRTSPTGPARNGNPASARHSTCTATSLNDSSTRSGSSVASPPDTTSSDQLASRW